VTDPTIDSQIVNLKNSGANVFFNITIPKFAVQAIKKSNDIGWKPLHFLNNVSSSLGTVLKPAGLEASRGLITALYMKEITDPQFRNDKGYQDWVAWMKKYYPEGALDDQFNAYAYNVAILLVHVLKQCGNDLSRDGRGTLLAEPNIRRVETLEVHERPASSDPKGRPRVHTSHPLPGITESSHERSAPSTARSASTQAASSVTRSRRPRRSVTG